MQKFLVIVKTSGRTRHIIDAETRDEARQKAIEEHHTDGGVELDDCTSVVHSGVVEK